MQKKIIALAIASAFIAPVAMAESSFYGSMDGGVRLQSNDDGVNASFTTFSMKMGQYNTSRWGFKGVDDLGDGMKANVVVETSFVPYGVGGNPDMNSAAPSSFSGVNTTNNPFGLIFDRQATVGLETSSMGKFDMGWNYTTSYTVIQSYDPFNYKFNGVALAKGAADADRAGNVVYSINAGGVTVIAEYDINNAFQSRQATSGTGRAIGATFAMGGFNVGGAYTTKDADVGYTNKHTHVTLGGGYSFGDAKVSVGYAKKTTKNDESSTTLIYDNTATNMWVGGSYNLSNKTTLTAAYYTKKTNTGGATAEDATANVAMVMATYAMSKKTTVYAEVDSGKTDNGTGSGLAGAVNKTSALSMGLDVKF